LAGALRAGDKQGTELARLSQLTTRQRRVLWRALTLIKRGRYEDAIVALETSIRDRKTEPPR
jgi:hypothetical protein